ncbi:MAG: bacterial transcriptional activator domain-containing protein [Anaerolineae bacterium]
MVDSAQQLALQQWQALGAETRLVVVQPNYAQQHVVLKPMLENAVYVRFQGSDLTVKALIEQVNEASIEQTGHPNGQGASTLVLDECDRAHKAALDDCLKSLLASFPGRIVVFSRYVPTCVLYDPQVRSVTRFIPVSEELMLWDYAQRSESGGSLLEVRALGEGRVQLNGERIENWDGVLPRALFFYLVDRGMVTRSEIFETFWGELSTREATNVFHVTKRKISEVLGLDLTVYWSGFYHISPRIQLSYDVSLFTQMLQDSAVMPLPQSNRLVEQAVSLYRGDFLTSIDMPWAERRRQDLRQSYGEALVLLAKESERVGKKHDALAQYLRATATHRQREDLVQNVMRLYRDLGMHQDALHVYHRLETDLKVSLNVTPGRSLQEFAAQIEAEQGQ